MNICKFSYDFLTDHKAKDIVTINVRNLSDVCDDLIIATGTSSRHVKSLGKNLVAECKKNKIPVLSYEGDDWWVLVDLGSVVAHIMQDEAREYYQLEKLWQQTPKT